MARTSNEHERDEQRKNPAEIFNKAKHAFPRWSPYTTAVASTRGVPVLIAKSFPRYQHGGLARRGTDHRTRGGGQVSPPPGPPRVAGAFLSSLRRRGPRN